MQAEKIRDNIYWVGAVDWSMRNFHGYETRRGSTYNAYLILDEKVTLIDTVKHAFTAELIDRIHSVIDPSKIDIIVSNHVEPDHSGALLDLHALAPQAIIYTSDPNGLKGLKGRYGELPYQPVKSGDSISLGKRTLSFIPTPLLHWPDSMVTYCPEEKILFSNDAFGQHYASSKHFDDENDFYIVMEEAKKYYANILMLYGRQAQTALKALASIDIDLIATGHGIIWRSNIKEIFDAYQLWSTNTLEDRAVVVFDSMWHSTEAMAKEIAETFTEAGIPAAFHDLKGDHISDIITEILTSRYIAVGSPTINNQMLPTVAAFLCYLKGLTAKEHKAFAFGSYGWGGQSIAQIEEELKASGCEIILDKQRILNVPSEDNLAALRKAVHEAVKG
ncbi:FprA family A-type flavoprotein [Selenomonas sp. TAMA-11512]|uniref:FprA family A-type flavoprotein n=1 Tax=Selenomonas sp. TAMA-11512 TaxID=3095337 RepID=UPI0030930346|nr:FprA family A-type flavoprotein [Selenomonas sp. TAMA-11512]